MRIHLLDAADRIALVIPVFSPCFPKSKAVFSVLLSLLWNSLSSTFYHFLIAFWCSKSTPGLCWFSKLFLSIRTCFEVVTNNKYSIADSQLLSYNLAAGLAPKRCHSILALQYCHRPLHYCCLELPDSFPSSTLHLLSALVLVHRYPTLSTKALPSKRGCCNVSYLL